VFLASLLVSLLASLLAPASLSLSRVDGGREYAVRRLGVPGISPDISPGISPGNLLVPVSLLASLLRYR
jgi:hypothetical protein